MTTIFEKAGELLKEDPCSWCDAKLATAGCHDGIDPQAGELKYPCRYKQLYDRERQAWRIVSAMAKRGK